MALTWKAVKKRWLPLIEEMERLGFEDYAEPELYRAAEAEIQALVAENKRLRRACAMALLELERTESTAAGDIAETVFDNWQTIREIGNAHISNICELEQGAIGGGANERQMESH